MLNHKQVWKYFCLWIITLWRKGIYRDFYYHISFFAQHQILKETMSCIYLCHFRHLKVLHLRWIPLLNFSGERETFRIKWLPFFKCLCLFTNNRALTHKRNYLGLYFHTIKLLQMHPKRWQLSALLC